MRRCRINLPNRCYHLISRVAHRAYFLDGDERTRLVDFVRRVAEFSGVKLLAYCVMSNHFHVVVYIGRPEPLSDAEIVRRISALYSDVRFEQVMKKWNELAKRAPKLAAAEIRLDEGWQAANRKGRAAMTRKTYCGNLLWQSSLTLLVHKGIGFLFIRKGVKLEPLLNGGQQENGIRAGTENVASIVGMATALKINCERMEENAAHLKNLTLRLRDGINRIFPDAVYLGDGVADQLPGFTSVSFPGHSAEGLLHVLDLKGIAVSSGAACDSKNTRVSHVLKAVNAINEIARSTIRITFGVENTDDDVDVILAALKTVLPINKEGSLP